MIGLPTTLDYPIVAIGDLHGQHHELSRLIGALENLPEWPDCSVVLLGDFVDRYPGVKQTIDLVLELLRRLRGGSAVLCKHIWPDPGSRPWSNHVRFESLLVYRTRI